MYQSNPELMKLQKEEATVEQRLKQLQHNQQRLKNRKSYYEKADRKKRTHRLCTIAGTIESIAPEIRELTLPEVNELLEGILEMSDVQRVCRWVNADIGSSHFFLQLLFCARHHVVHHTAPF